MKIEKNEFIDQLGGVLRSPQKFYFLLMLSGFSGQRAQQIVYDLKYPKQRLANPASRKEILNLLTTIINLITTDSMLYNRFRLLAQQKHIFKEQLSVGSGSIAGLGYPSAEADPPPASIKSLLKYVKKNTKNKNKMNPLIFADQVLKRNSA
jgi:hypothetical protein